MCYNDNKYKLNNVKYKVFLLIRDNTENTLNPAI